MIIGVPKEIMPGERRVAASPETAAKMVKDGLTVLVEKDAGEGAFYHDSDYVAAGAAIVDDVCDKKQTSFLKSNSLSSTKKKISMKWT